jgi:hypothetical protein
MKAFEYGDQFGPNVDIRGDEESHGFNVKARTRDYVTLEPRKDATHRKSLQTREDHRGGVYDMDGSIVEVEMSYICGGRSRFRRDSGPGDARKTINI